MSTRKSPDETDVSSIDRLPERNPRGRIYRKGISSKETLKNRRETKILSNKKKTEEQLQLNREEIKRQEKYREEEAKSAEQRLPNENIELAEELAKEEIHNLAVDSYTSVDKLTDDDIKKTVIENNIKIIPYPFKQEIADTSIKINFNFYPPGYNDKKTYLQQCYNSIPMGKDAALSGIVSHAKSYLDCLKIGNYTSILKEKSKDGDGDDDEQNGGSDDKEEKNRAGVPKAWKAGLENTTGYKNATKALIGNLAFPKAIMDSACLGETVNITLQKNLCELMTNKIRTTINNSNIQNEVLKNFLITMSNCDVFELVSSDILGAVNSSYTIRAIHDTLPFASYVSIPKASGGQIGTDVDVFIFALIIHDMLDIHNYYLPESFTNITELFDPQKSGKELKETITQVYLSFNIGGIDMIKKQITSDMSLYKEYLKSIRGGINSTSPNNTQQEFFSLSSRIAQYIISFGNNFIQQKTNKDSAYNKIKNAIDSSYTTNESKIISGTNPTILHENIVWFSFQIFRYIQSFKNVNLENNTINTWNTKWYEALKNVAINEAFAGHDNNSTELLALGQEVYPNELGWTRGTGTGSSGWNKIHKELVKRIQKDTKCMFLQYSPIPGSTKRGVLFSTNTDMVDNRKIGNKTTPTGTTVYELFMDNIGPQRIISTYDLENYEGETVITEKGEISVNKVLGRNTIEALVTTNRSKDKILEIQGILCTLDRASRISHPKTIYCTGLLNLPFYNSFNNDQLKLTTIISYQVNTPIKPEEKTPVLGDNTSYSPGLHEYNLYLEKDISNISTICQNKYNNNNNSPNYINIVLCFIEKIYNTLLTPTKKKFIQQATHAPKQPSSEGECDRIFKEFMNKSINATKVLELLENIMYFKIGQPKGSIWMKTFSYIICSGDISTGNAVVKLKDELPEHMETNETPPMKTIITDALDEYNKYYYNLFTQNEYILIPSTNIPWIVDQPTLVQNDMSIFINRLGFQIGMFNHNLNQIQPVTNQFLNNSVKIIPQELINNFIFNIQNLYTPSDLSLLNQNLNSEHAYKDALDLFTNGYIAYTQNQSILTNSVQTIGSINTEIKPALELVNKPDIELTNDILILTYIRQSAASINTAILGRINSNETTNVQKDILKRIGSNNHFLQSMINNQITLISQKQQNQPNPFLFDGGGTPEDLKDLDGKIVAFKKENGKYIIVDYEQLLKLYFEQKYGEGNSQYYLEKGQKYIQNILNTPRDSQIIPKIPTQEVGQIPIDTGKGITLGQEREIRKQMKQGLSEAEARSEVLSAKWQQTAAPGPVVSQGQVRTGYIPLPKRTMGISDIREPTNQNGNIQYAYTGYPGSNRLKNGGKFTRKRNLNRKTRKRNKKIRGRKTHHKLKSNHRYTRHKK